jgi:hypothetical protein
MFLKSRPRLFNFKQGVKTGPNFIHKFIIHSQTRLTQGDTLKFQQTKRKEKIYSSDFIHKLNRTDIHKFNKANFLIYPKTKSKQNGLCK